LELSFVPFNLKRLSAPSFDGCLNCQGLCDQRRCRRHILDKRRGFERDDGGIEDVAILGLNLPPDCCGRLADAIFGDEFARHRGQHIVVLVE